MSLDKPCWIHRLDVPEAAVGRLARLFDESLLPVKVDLLVYDRIAHAPLKVHIDRVALPLLAHAPLPAVKA